MDNIKDDQYYAKKILADLVFLIKHTKSISQEEFNENEVLLDSVMFRFIQISANIKLLTDSFKNKYNQIPWKSIIGLRNKIVHDYGKIDHQVIYSTVKNDIYELERLFLDIVEE